MSLTDLNGKETITVYQVELERLALLKQMLAKDFDLEEKIRVAYELPVELQAKADNAKKAIADNQALVAEQKKDLQELNDKLLMLDEQKKSLEIIHADLDKKNRKLADDLKSLELAQDEFKKNQNILKDDRLKLETEKKANNEFGVSLDEREAELDQAEADLKARENKLKEIIGG